MHGHGVHGFDIIEPARQDKAHATLAVIARKGDTQNLLAGLGALTLRKLEGDADIAVHQTQAVVIAGHQNRTAFVPLLVTVDQACP
ncbi:hypothetical protein D3C85_1330100 [compost metagenome]